MSEERYYIGVDPGLSGGVAVLTEDATVHILLKTPDSEAELWEIFDEILPVPAVPVLLEKVHSRPGQSAVATFSFGQIYGFTRACLTAAELQFEDVQPKAWQKVFGLKKDKLEEYDEYKRRIRDLAQSLFPDVFVTLKTADALLIAEYCRRKALHMVK